MLKLPQRGDTRTLDGALYVVATVDPILSPGSSKRGTTTNVAVVGHSVGLKRVTPERRTIAS
jgi:hypothetical protein